MARRAVLLALGLGAVAGVARRAPAAEKRTLLDEREPAARNIGYVANAREVDVKTNPGYRRGQSCATCTFIDFGTARHRGCSLVPGRLVEAAGWCRLWKLKGSK